MLIVGARARETVRSGAEVASTQNKIAFTYYFMDF
jgi:hypothetical protein